jgi:hypothetical protein
VDWDSCGGFPFGRDIFCDEAVAKHLGRDFTFGVEETQVAAFEAVFARG